MKRFFILYIIAVIVGVLCIWLDYNRYMVGFADETGKIVVPIKYHYAIDQIQYDKIGTGETFTFIGTNFFRTDVYDKRGILFQTKGIYQGGTNNVKIYRNGLRFADVYYKDKLIEKKVLVLWPIKPFFEITDKTGKKNFLNSETGKYILPKKYDVINLLNDQGLIYASDNTQSEYYLDDMEFHRKIDENAEKVYELYDLKGNKLYSGSFPADGVYKDLVINTGKLYSKDRKVYNNTSFGKWTIYNDKLYVIIDYKPYVYNREKNTFDKTDIDYVRIGNTYDPDNQAFCVHQNGKFGIIMGDYKTPIIYDNVLRMFNKTNDGFVVIKDNKYGAIGPKINIPCKYDMVSRDFDAFYKPKYNLYVVMKTDKNMNLSEDFKGVKELYTKPIEYDRVSAEPMIDQIKNIKPPKMLYTVANASGKELIPYISGEIEITPTSIIATKQINGFFNLTYIYDHTGKEKMKLKIAGDLIGINLYKTFDNKYIDLETYKTYNSVNDYIISKNPHNQTLKDAEISNFGYSGYFIRYKKPIFRR